MPCVSNSTKDLLLFKLTSRRQPRWCLVGYLEPHRHSKELLCRASASRHRSRKYASIFVATLQYRHATEYFGIHANHEFRLDRKSTRLNSSHVAISYAVFCL